MLKGFGAKLGEVINEALDTTSFEEAKPYLQHSTLAPVKPVYKIFKMIENLANMNDPTYRWEQGFDEL